MKIDLALGSRFVVWILRRQFAMKGLRTYPNRTAVQ